MLDLLFLGADCVERLARGDVLEILYSRTSEKIPFSEHLDK
jgi:hypothetical protein